jgi:hypothetical protein
MQNKAIDSVDIAYDYESVKRRIINNGIKRESKEKLNFANEYIGRRIRTYRGKMARSQSKSVANIFTSNTDFLENGGQHIVIKCIIGICLVLGIGNAIYFQYSEQRESEFGQKCSLNNLRHLSNNICYDENRHVQTLNPDGTAKKSVMDWNVWRETEFADKVANSR